MRELLLVRYGEVHLKGQNRPYFLRTLVNAVRRAVREIGGNVWISDSRIFVSDAQDMDECIRRVTKVFGVHSVCPAIEMEKNDFDAVCAQAVQMMRPLSGTFKVNARRSDKHYPIDSPEINRRVGERVLEALPGLRVDVHSPDHVLSVEIRDKAYLYVRCIPAVNGMPLGTNGRACLLLSGGIDSPVAGFMIAKRGVEICCVHYHSFPYTSERAKEKVVELARILSEYCGKIRLYVVPFTQIQMDPPEVPGPLHHADHAPVHDAHRRARGAYGRRAGAHHGRERRPGRQPDDGGARVHGRGGRHAGLPPVHRL